MNVFFYKFKFVLVLFFLTSSYMNGQGMKNMFARNPMKNKANFDQQNIHWGYFLGFNAYDFKIDMLNDAPPILVERTTGFNVGLVGNVRLHEYLDFRFEPGLYYTQRNLLFPGFDNIFDARREVKSTYIHFPFLLKFSSQRVGNVRPYLLAGLSYTLNLSSNFDAIDDNEQDIFRMKQWTPNYEIGFGIDLYFEYFKFSPSIRGVFGVEDELIRDNDPNSPWTGNVASMRTRGVFVNFTFH